MGEKGLTTTNNTALTATEVRKQVNLIQEIMENVMKENEHYGKVPGCGNKPTLLKPGAEKLMMTFRLAAEYEELLGSTEGDSFICYKINCKLTHIPTGQIIGNGRGVCNSKEKKYRTRSVYLNKATEEEKAIGKEETRKGDSGTYKVLIVPQDPWDVQNTIYKMACKRALVAAVLNATAASDIFTQDLEEIGEEVVLEENPPMQKPATAAPRTTHEEPIDSAILTVSAAKKLPAKQSFDVGGVLVSFKTDKVGANKKDITRYIISDTQDEAELIKISQWGKAMEGVQNKDRLIFRSVTGTIYQNEMQYIANSIEPDMREVFGGGQD